MCMAWYDDLSVQMREMYGVSIQGRVQYSRFVPALYSDP